MNTALILIDFINEIVNEKGKLSSKGYFSFAKENNVFKNISFIIEKARQKNILIIHVKVGFSKNYNEQPKESPLFGKAKEFQALKLNTWATDFYKEIDIKEEDIIIIKHRVSAFYSTSLDLVLKNNNIKSVIIAGVATDLAVSSTVRDAHDRDYKVTIVSDCCIAGNIKDHEGALLSLSKISDIKKSQELFI
ncbi:MAG: cysteine hydrolase family protein [Candidatus Pacebacteria bacterium]|nr:cysteine hydrolase family protein [Candidatus Paceibacterota bacterium]MDD3729260.1 cysteine hydrolase family protein [Candidatus Paceibacterota bacterium]MDD4466944.1 cysteine hydrolase family protein [Candidatus Paceibacterota bacterium]MDD4897438.1 cysteine hydrolase family protein [Candidatus Paceibacterota bacterium]MDD5445740.1 cysteine hydrolase family protein [Candidatus Paceibacterota bacterium]